MRPTGSTPVATTLVLLLFSLLFNSGDPTPIPGLDSFLTQQYQLDPHASNDTLPSLPSRLKSSLSLSSPSTTNRISSLLSLTLPVAVHVTLIGSSFSSSSPSTLSSFISASLSSHPFQLITPSDHHYYNHHRGGNNDNNHLNHRLSLSHSLHLTSSLSSPSLTSSLRSAVIASLNSSVSSLRSSLNALSYTVTDNIIASHHRATHPPSSTSDDTFHIYIINLGQIPKPYAYAYTTSTAGSIDISSPAYTKCLGTIWTGTDRYIWIDLSAGPVDYGPALSGDGLLPRGEFHPLAVIHGKPKVEKAVMADLASLVYSAYHTLIVPSLRIPVPYENTLVVQFIHINGNDHSADSKSNYGLDWGVIERTFVEEAKEKGVLFKDQSLSFKKYEIKYQECALCSLAISKSISSYTSRFLFDNYTLIVSEYVDSKKLHQILVDSAEEFKRLGVVHEEDDFGRVLPVYVFDLDSSTLLLLDRFLQSVAFKDMVIAIRTKNSQTVSDYSCNGKHIFTQTRELERPLIGSILQSMWGVSPTHLMWSPTHNSTLVDFTWSVGQTPFGPFSEISSLSFVQKDAARRNVLLTSLNYSISSAVEVLESAKAHGGYQKLLKGHQHTEFSQRWFLFKYKIDKMISALSHLDFELASYYLRSSDHDLYAMHSIVYHASQEIEATLTCFKDPPFPWGSFSMSVAILFLLCYVYVKRDKFFSNKRKQF